MAEIFTPEEAHDIALSIQQIARNEARAAVEALQGSARGYVWGIYDSDAVPLYIWTYEVDLACQPVDCRITTDVLNPGAIATVAYNLGGGWITLCSLGIDGIVGGTASFEIATLPVGTLLTLTRISGKGVVVNLRVRRIGEHTGAGRA